MALPIVDHPYRTMPMKKNHSITWTIDRQKFLGVEQYFDGAIPFVEITRHPNGVWWFRTKTRKTYGYQQVLEQSRWLPLMYHGIPYTGEWPPIKEDVIVRPSRKIARTPTLTPQQVLEHFPAADNEEW